MSFAISFFIWAVGGTLIGWLARRYEPNPPVHPYPYVILGLVGGILGGLLWFSVFEVSPALLPGSFFFIFEFLSFNIFSTLFGFIGAFWAVHMVHLIRDRRSNISAPSSSTRRTSMTAKRS
jgi:uncharacterized membrane protein YeaQ/YmgE (transglycosylase-associated protein family)